MKSPYGTLNKVQRDLDRLEDYSKRDEALRHKIYEIMSQRDKCEKGSVARTRLNGVIEGLLLARRMIYDSWN